MKTMVMMMLSIMMVGSMTVMMTELVSAWHTVQAERKDG